MSCKTIPVPVYILENSISSIETVETLAEELGKLMDKRPLPKTDQSKPGARDEYARTVGYWFLYNSGLFCSSLKACSKLCNRVALELEELMPDEMEEKET